MYQLKSARVAMLVGGALASFASAAEPPLIIPHENWQNVLRLPDGELWLAGSGSLTGGVSNRGAIRPGGVFNAGVASFAAKAPAPPRLGGTDAASAAPRSKTENSS